MVITGSNFSTLADTRVRLYQWGGDDDNPGGINTHIGILNIDFVVLPAPILYFPNKFTVVVVHYTVPLATRTHHTVYLAALPTRQ